MTPELLRPRRLLAASALALAAASAPAAAQTVGYTLTPPYAEGANGNNGWYRVPVTATYTCAPPPGYTVVCPGPDTFSHQAGTSANPAPPPARIPTPGGIVRPVTFTWAPILPLPDILPPPIVVNTTLQSTPGVNLKVDTLGPGTPTVTAPTARTYDAGSVVKAAYSCYWGAETSGQWPGTPCVGTVAVGANINTGTADTPATYGAKSFTVTAKDLAGNTSLATVNYTVDELPGPPALSTPAAGATVDARPTFTWTPPTDDGSGLKAYRLTVTPSSGAPVTFEVTSPSNPVVFTPLDDLPAGAAKWAVTFVDKRDRTAATGQRNITLVLNTPGAPKLVNSVARTSDPRPAFSWTPAEPGGTFQWEIASAGAAVQGPTITPATTMTAATLSPGSYTFRVRQISGLGRNGAWSAVAPFVVDAIPVTTTPTTPTPTPTPPAPTTTRRTPPVQNPRRMKPRAGAGLKAAPTLRWVRQPKATLYNVQVFRVYGTKYIKVLTAFPRGNTLKLSRKKILKGRRYVWRVWPYIGGTRRYTPKPLGVSWFAVRK
ncbi:MAG: hypothetical protein IT200_07855 [Thermoleophilia bacterium]|nr:hypothetical protein [Thermoleophilia bacterium]